MYGQSFCRRWYLSHFTKWNRTSVRIPSPPMVDPLTTGQVQKTCDADAYGDLWRKCRKGCSTCSQVMESSCSSGWDKCPSGTMITWCTKTEFPPEWQLPGNLVCQWHVSLSDVPVVSNDIGLFVRINIGDGDFFYRPIPVVRQQHNSNRLPNTNIMIHTRWLSSIPHKPWK